MLLTSNVQKKSKMLQVQTENITFNYEALIYSKREVGIIKQFQFFKIP